MFLFVCGGAVFQGSRPLLSDSLNWNQLAFSLHYFSCMKRLLLSVRFGSVYELKLNLG